MNHPDLPGRQVRVCFQSSKSELNMEKQRSVIMPHTGPLQLSPPNQGWSSFCLPFTEAISRLRTAKWLLFSSLFSFKPFPFQPTFLFPVLLFCLLVSFYLFLMSFSVICVPLWSTLSHLLSELCCRNKLGSLCLELSCFLVFMASCRAAVQSKWISKSGPTAQHEGVFLQAFSARHRCEQR